ncbi:MAG: hypothetical protein A2V70_05485 [Planctomycetes bacterium RBG_13_63_9]|nr:MAG: hypothetical protein A2V70_05485 [Planctomycetes bacterium RBG_13_63_9]
MSAFDQAFIKAYTQQDATSAVPRTASAESMSLSEALRNQPAKATAPELETLCPTDGEDRIEPPLRPMLQVDRFNWPQVCRRLGEEAAEELDRLTDALMAAMAAGQKVLAIGGCCPGGGTTTLVLCAAQRLAGRRLKVAMVEGNLGDPRLAKRLGLAPEYGWQETLGGRLPLEEVVIESADGQLALLPLCEPFAGTGDAAADQARMAESIETLSGHYDLILVDLGSLEDAAGSGDSLGPAIMERLDGIVLIDDVRDSKVDRLAEVRRALATAEIRQLGIIQNFVSTHKRAA